MTHLELIGQTKLASLYPFLYLLDIRLGCSHFPEYEILHFASRCWSTSIGRSTDQHRGVLRHSPCGKILFWCLNLSTVNSICKKEIVPSKLTVWVLRVFLSYSFQVFSSNSSITAYYSRATGLSGDIKLCLNFNIAKYKNTVWLLAPISHALWKNEFIETDKKEKHKQTNIAYSGSLIFNKTSLKMWKCL